jgi:hypothetical protein
MKDITQNINLLESKYSKKYCGLDSINLCQKQHCTCKVASELKAYMESIIPDPYYKYSINDFTGKNSLGEKLIPNDILFKAREQLVKYCWKNISFNDIKNSNLDELNILESRRLEGKNVIIYSDSNEVEDFSNKKSLGKTFIASLIMKEIIKRRVFPGNHIQSYEWTPFSYLVKILKDDGVEASGLKGADWLVIDDISRSKGSREQNKFVSSIIDPLFIERVQDKRPTIFVFRFNVEKEKRYIEEEFGAGLARIINDPKTHKIALTD